jgi:hypothetical protein
VVVLGLLGGCGDAVAPEDAAMVGTDAYSSADAAIEPGADAGPTPDAPSTTDAPIAMGEDAPSAMGTFPSCDGSGAAFGGFAGTCTEYRGLVGDDGSSIRSGCEAGSGMVILGPCGATSAVGRCTMGTGMEERVLYYYESFMPPGGMSIEAYGESRCMMRMGTWELL